MSDIPPTPGSDHRRPLDGIRVLDWAEGVAGPYSCQLMADLGADVVKVERPQGDWGRDSGPGDGGHHFRAYNRNKRNLCLDLAHPGGREVAYRLIENADAMVTAFRPGVTERLGIGYEHGIERNPSLVYVRISAYGYDGPLSPRPGSDTILQAVSGLMSQIGEPDGDPQRVGVPVIDILAARDAVIGVLGRLLTRSQGPPPPVDVSLFASAASFQAQLWQTYFDIGTVQQRAGHRHPSLAPGGLYRTQDGRHITVAVLRDEHFAKVCTALDLGDLAVDPRFATNALRLENRQELEGIIVPAFASRPFDELVPRLLDHDILAGPVMQIPDIEADPAMVAALPIVEVLDPHGAPAGRSLGSPMGIGSAVGPEPAAARRGAHTRAVLSDVGYSEAEIEELVASGVTPDDGDSES